MSFGLTYTLWSRRSTLFGDENGARDRSGHAVGEGFELLAAASASRGDRTSWTIRPGWPTSRAHVVALVPGPVAGVLADDVQFFAGLRVVFALDVEVAGDLERRDDLSVLVLRLPLPSMP